MSSWIYSIDDPRDRWIARDKFWHGGLSLGVMLLIGFLGGDLDLGAVYVFIVGVMVEVFQVARWLVALTPDQRQAIEAGVVRWPWMMDKVSLKDLAVDVLGIVVGVLLMYSYRAV